MIKRLILIFTVTIIVISIFGSLYLYNKLHSSIPQREGSIELNAIHAPVTIIFDQMGVPQVWASSSEDLWFALGWLHASDRLFQMDLTRKVAQGRLAEYFGSSVLEIDRSQRKIGHTYLADNAVDSLGGKAEQLLSGYAQGINSFVDTHDELPFEYLILGIEFEKWTVHDCLTLFSFQTWFSDALQNNDDLYNEILNCADPSATKHLLMGEPVWIPTTVPSIKTWYSLDNLKNELAKNLFCNGVGSFLMSSASNSWVISPKKSKSGYAMLASDPHLEISRLPQFWYMIGLHCPNENINVLGISSPGVPIIVFGHNGQAAWAFTAGGVDIADQYIEMVNPKDSTQYKAPTGWKNFALRDEVIVASDKALPETLVVRTSRHGPVMSQNDSLSEAYTMHWAGFDRSLADAAESAVELMTVNNFKDFRKIVTRFGALNANWMYADARGNIGYQLGTPIPIRQNSENVFKLKGWMDENDWNGYQPIENTPHSFNPDRGWLATCNNPPVSDEFGYRLPGNYAGDRILRIVKLLDSNETLSQSDIMFFQNDVHSQFILRWRKPVAEVLQQLGETNLAGNIGQWDGRLATDSKEAALVETWLMNLKDQTFRDELGDLTDQMHLRVLFRDRVLYRLYMEGQSSWFDDKTTEDQIETRNDIALRAMKKTIAEIGDKTWGEMQQVTMAHPMAVIPVLSGLLGLEHGPFPRGGNPGTLNASTSIPDGSGGFNVLGGPSWRFVIDFANIDNVQMVIPSGQSGNPMDEHFFDFYALWSKGEYWNIPFNKSAIIAKKKSVLELIPTNLD